MRALTIVLFPLAALIAFAMPGASSQPAQITILVRDQTDALIPKAEIEYRRHAAGRFRYVCADAVGKASLSLRPGDYDLRVSSRGFRTLQKELHVSAGEAQAVKLVLRVRQTTDSVMVTRENPWLQTTDPSLSVPASPGPDFNRALERFKRDVRQDPANAGLHNSLGICYVILNEETRARAEFKKAAELDPARATHAYYNLAFVSTNFDEKIKDLRKAIQLDRKNADAYQLLGQTLMKKANHVVDGRQRAPRAAVRAFKAYMKLQPRGLFAQRDAGIIKDGLPVPQTYPCTERASSVTGAWTPRHSATAFPY